VRCRSDDGSARPRRLRSPTHSCQNATGVEPFDELRPAEREIVGPSDDRAAAQQRRVDLLDADVEGDRGELQDPVVGAQSVELARRVGVVDQTPM
jgi:hypothetical protein